MHVYKHIYEHVSTLVSTHVSTHVYANVNEHVCFRAHHLVLAPGPRCRNQRSETKVKPELNHVVLLIRYGSERQRNYWKVKNSWGTQCGEDGGIYSHGVGMCVFVD